jgi:hypothetical protein
MKGPQTSGSSHFTSLCPFLSSSVRLRAGNTGARGAIRLGFEFGMSQVRETGEKSVPVPMSSSRRARCASMAERVVELGRNPSLLFFSLLTWSVGRVWDYVTCNNDVRARNKLSV